MEKKFLKEDDDGKKCLQKIISHPPLPPLPLQKNNGPSLRVILLLCTISPLSSFFYAPILH